VTDDDLVPISVRLGEVVPPEDPEDWTRPLTWMAAAGMLIAPLVALAWFAVARPSDTAPLPMTWVLAAALAAGAALTGASQAGARWAFAGTLGSGLFGALATVLIGVALSGERQMGVASPPLAHAFLASMWGLVGAAAGSGAAAGTAAWSSRWTRAAMVAAVGTAGSLAAAAISQNLLS
jgi:hypothetical protein